MYNRTLQKSDLSTNVPDFPAWEPSLRMKLRFSVKTFMLNNSFTLAPKFSSLKFKRKICYYIRELVDKRWTIN